MDAGAFGARLSPRDAYRFAKGEEVTASGQRAKLSRPLDFMVVADHSDNMGFFPDLFAGKPEVLADPTGRRWYDMIQSGQGPEAAIEIIVAFSQGKWPKKLAYLPDGTLPLGLARDDQGGRRGQRSGALRRSSASSGPPTPAATTCTATSSSARTAPRPTWSSPTPLKPLGSDNPRDLWKWMADTEQKTGSEVLALAHNGNLSNGRMFRSSSRSPANALIATTPTTACAGSRSTRRRRSRATARRIRSWRPTMSSPTSSAGTRATWTSARPRNEMLEFEYARSALKNGLKMEQELGVNPYKFIGSTDAHTALAAVEEDNFFGKHSGAEPGPARATHPFVKSPSGAVIMGWEMTASGYAAVWATENTREALFDAMKRRETYATTGPRMLVRFLAAGISRQNARAPLAGEDRLHQGCADGR